LFWSQVLLTSAPLALVWLFLFDRLRVDWEINPQYQYGWTVPALALVAFWQRWASRPEPTLNRVSTGVPLVAVALLFLQLPLRLVEEANPEWRMALWIHAGSAVGLTFALLHHAGGRPWTRHFAFPVAFTLMSVPLPTGLEQGLIQSLARLVTTVTVELADWMGIPAIQHGNVIEISSGLVGIEEACSGVRSLQTSFLVSLFLGEFCRMTLPRRLLHFGVGIGLAVSANVGRTVYLVQVASSAGLPAMHRVHDAAGLWVMAFVLAGLFLTAWWLRSRTPVVGPPASRLSGGRLPPARFAVGAMLWLMSVPVITEGWYRLHERAAQPNMRWHLRPLGAEAGFTPQTIPEAARAMLRCSSDESFGWQDAEANHYTAFFLRWEPGRNSAQLAKGHQPEICLTGAGARLVQRFGSQKLDCASVEVPFDQYLFEARSRPLHVFYGRWEDRSVRLDDAPPEDGSQASRIRAVVAGRRHQGQTVLEVAVEGPDTPEEARRAFSRQLPFLLVPSP
jgi:exosortase